MQKFQNLLLLLAVAALTFAACHKHDDEDTTAPVITLETPTEGAVLPSGEIHIHGTVTDESLHEMHILVLKDSDFTELFDVEPVVHDLTSYSFDEHFAPSSLAGETDLTLFITVEDHSSNKTTKTVKFKVKP